MPSGHSLCFQLWGVEILARWWSCSGVLVESGAAERSSQRGCGPSGGAGGAGCCLSGAGFFGISVDVSALSPPRLSML